MNEEALADHPYQPRPLRHYRGDLTEAREGFAALEDRDPASAKYLAKIDSMGGQVPEGWNGIWVMTSK